MSDKGSESVQNKSLNTVFKWIFIILAVSVLEAGAIFSAVKIIESRGQADVANLKSVDSKLSSQQMQINELGQISTKISAVGRQIQANAQALNELAEDFNKLNDEVGNNKLSNMADKIAEINHRVEGIEENTRGEALVLNLALLIKESVLYQRTFAQEADLLSEISSNKPEIKLYIDVISNYKNKQFPNNAQLARQYADLAPLFHFGGEKEISSEPENPGVVAKGVKMLKGTVAKLNFDKVIVMKKDKLTEQQTALIIQLNNLVKSYNFKEALDIIAEHNELKNTDEVAFIAWQNEIADKLKIEDALTQLTIKQLGTLRQDVKDEKIQIPAVAQEETQEEVKDTAPISTEETTESVPETPTEETADE